MDCLRSRAIKRILCLLVSDLVYTCKIASVIGRSEMGNGMVQMDPTSHFTGSSDKSSCIGFSCTCFNAGNILASCKLFVALMRESSLTTSFPEAIIQRYAVYFEAPKRFVKPPDKSIKKIFKMYSTLPGTFLCVSLQSVISKTSPLL